MQTPPVVIIPSDRPASLGIARSLGKRGVPVHGIDADPHAIGMASKYLKPHPLPNADNSEQNRLQMLVDLGKGLSEKAVLFPVSDDNVMLCSQHRDELKKYYHFVMPEHETICNLLTKDGLHQVAKEHDIPHPLLFQANSIEDIIRLDGQLPYPLILKPVFSPSWLNPEIITLLRTEPLSGPPKVALCHSFNELLETYRKITAFDCNVIIEEVIPGEEERLVYLCFYLDRQSKPLALFAGEKLRVLPVGFGSATYVRSFHDPDLEAISLKLLAGTRYQGLGGVEFKKDERDEQYKLIEFNARLGMWDSFGAKCGVDIPYIAYRDALGEPTEVCPLYRDNVFWIDFQRDVRAFLISKKHGKLSLAQWFKSLWCEKEWAVYAPGDWKPAFNATLKLFDRPFKLIRNLFGARQ